MSMAGDDPVPPPDYPGLRSLYTKTGVMWQTIIHRVFILSAIGIAAVDRMGQPPSPQHH